MEYNYLLVKTDCAVNIFTEKYGLKAEQVVSQNNFILVKNSENRNKKLFTDLKEDDIPAYFIEEKIFYKKIEIEDIRDGIRVERDLLYVFNKNTLLVFKIGVFEIEMIYEEGNVVDFAVSEKYCIYYKNGYFTVLSDDMRIFNMIYGGAYDNFTIDGNSLIVDGEAINILTGDSEKDYAKNNLIQVSGDTILHKNFTREHKNLSKYEIFDTGKFPYIKIEKKIAERKIYLLEAYDEKIYSLNLSKDYDFMYYGNLFLLYDRSTAYLYEKRNIFVLLKQFTVGESLFALNKHLLIYDIRQEVLSLYDKNRHLKSVKIENITSLNFAPNGLLFYAQVRDTVQVYDLNCNLIWKKNFTGIDRIVWQPYNLSEETVDEEDIEKYLGDTKNENIERQFSEPIEEMKMKWIAFLEKQRVLLQ